MKICEKVKEIIKTNNANEFQNLVEFLRHTNCKTEAEIRGIFSNCGMQPEKFDLLRKINK